MRNYFQSQRDLSVLKEVTEQELRAPASLIDFQFSSEHSVVMNRLHHALCLALFLSFISRAEEPPPWLLELQSKAAAFEQIEVPPVGEVLHFTIKLGEVSVELENGQRYSGFRFQAPPQAETASLIWYFNASTDWSGWYIVPLDDEIKPGFRNFMRADRLYEQDAKLPEDKRYRILQTLDSGFMESGKNYFMWFNQTGEEVESPSLLQVSWKLEEAQEEVEWDRDAVEDALGLEPAPLENQVELLDSRGGRILLDPTFFTRSDAKRRINQVFTSIRQFRRTTGGFFVYTEYGMPPCKTNPSFAEIREKYGEPDFERTDQESMLKRTHQLYEDSEESKEEEEEVENTTHYMYDYFSFVVDSDDPDGPVKQVKAHAQNYKQLQPDTQKATFRTLGTQNITVFFDQGKEVGRMYYFRESNKLPLVITEPPPGTYTWRDTELMYSGGGIWMVKAYKDETLFSKNVYEDHLLNGKGLWYFPDGSLRFSVEHQAGLYHGEFIERDQQGEILRKLCFDQGQEVPCEEM